MVTMFSIPLILTGAAIIIITYLESAQAEMNLLYLLFYAIGFYIFSTGLGLKDE